MTRIGTINNTSNLAPSCSLGEAWESSQLEEIFSSDNRALIEEGFHDLFRGYYERLDSNPIMVTSKEASELVENIGITLVEKVNSLNRLITMKDDHMKALENRELRINPFSEELGHSTAEKTPSFSHTSTKAV